MVRGELEKAALADAGRERDRRLPPVACTAFDAPGILPSLDLYVRAAPARERLSLGAGGARRDPRAHALLQPLAQPGHHLRRRRFRRAGLERRLRIVLDPELDALGHLVPRDPRRVNELSSQ